MFKHLFDNVKDINYYSIFSLIVFFVFFIAIGIWLVKADKKHIEEMSRKPLESNDNSFTD